MSKIKKKLKLVDVSDIKSEKWYFIKHDNPNNPCYLVEGDDALRIIFKWCGFDFDDKEKMDKLGGIKYLQENDPILNLAEGYVEKPGKGRGRGMVIFELFEYEEGEKKIDDLLGLIPGKRYYRHKKCKSGVYQGSYLVDGEEEIRFKYSWNHDYNCPLMKLHDNDGCFKNGKWRDYTECNEEFDTSLWDKIYDIKK
jgi:hypothetical protein